MPNRGLWLTAAGVVAVVLVILGLALLAVYSLTWFS